MNSVSFRIAEIEAEVPRATSYVLRIIGDTKHLFDYQQPLTGTRVRRPASQLLILRYRIFTSVKGCGYHIMRSTVFRVKAIAAKGLKKIGLAKARIVG